MAALVLGSALGARPAAAEDLNRIVLRINEEILTLHQYETRRANEIATILSRSRLGTEERQELLEKVGRVTMQNFFSELLLTSFARQQSIRVTDTEVAESIQQLRERQGISTQEEFTEALAASGMTPQDLRDSVHRDLLWQQVISREVNPKVKMNDEEVRAYYRNNKEAFRVPEKRWLKEVIILESSGLEDAELRRIAGEIGSSLATGSELEEVVAPYREKEITTGVIDLDWLSADELESSLSEAVWALSPGDYSPPIAARGGYHIVHLAGLRESVVRPLSEVQNQIARREYNTRFGRELRTFLAKLEERSYIQDDVPTEAVGYRALASPLETVEDELEIFRAPTLEAKPEEEPESGEAPTGG